MTKLEFYLLQTHWREHGHVDASQYRPNCGGTKTPKALCPPEFVLYSFQPLDHLPSDQVMVFANPSYASVCQEERSPR
jgi:hypothetical protein